VGNLSIAADLVASIGDDDPPVQLIGEDGGRAAKHGGLAGTRTAHDEDVATSFEEIAERLRNPRDGASVAEGETDDLMIPVPDARDPVKRSIYAGSIVLPETRDTAEDVLQVFVADLPRQRYRRVMIAKVKAGRSAQIQFNLFDVLQAPSVNQRHNPARNHG
jgi:hypothetical protein